MIVEVDIDPIAYEQTDVEWLPDRRPYGYQWQAYQKIKEALEANTTLCLFLVTPTGSGKTLGSYAYSILHGMPAMGVYPTNELITDQERALRPEYERVQGWPDWAMKVDSRRLDLWQANLALKRHGETLEALLNWHKVVLTNPDILYYIVFGRYPALPGLRERLFSRLADIYALFGFDEFHLYNVKQIANVAFLIGALRAIQPDKGRAFVFASATPQPLFRSLLEDRLGVQVQELKAEPSHSPEARTIAHPVHLTIASADLERWQGPATLEDSIQVVDAFRHEYSSGRFVAIFDAVAAAIGVARLLRERYPGLEVGEVHGLSSATARDVATRCQATVGTSTIEVGIDFKEEREKDFLIFEARTSGQFIQRLGRIARHEKRLPIPITGDSPARAAGKHRHYKETGILAPLLTFRGSDFEAAILDGRRDDPGFPAKRYSLPFLLRRGVFEELSEEAFLAEVEALRHDRSDWVEEVALAQRYSTRIEATEDALLGVYGHFRLESLTDKARRLWFELGQDQVWGRKGEVTVISDLSVGLDPPDSNHIRQLNRFLQRKRLVAWFMDVHPAAVRFGRALPALFPVHELSPAHHEELCKLG